MKSGDLVSWESDTCLGAISGSGRVVEIIGNWVCVAKPELSGHIQPFVVKRFWELNIESDTDDAGVNILDNTAFS